MRTGTPGVFLPREIGGRELVDGALVSPLPVGTARQLGCDIVLAADVGSRPNRAALSGLYEVVLQSFEIMGRTLTQQEAKTAELLLPPDTPAHASTNFNARREMMQVDYEAAQRAPPKLRRRLNTPLRTRTGALRGAYEAGPAPTAADFSGGTAGRPAAGPAARPSRSRRGLRLRRPA